MGLRLGTGHSAEGPTGMSHPVSQSGLSGGTPGAPKTRKVVTYTNQANNGRESEEHRKAGGGWVL